MSPTVGPVDGRTVPRYAGAPTFARLPRIDEVSRHDVAVLGAPFDSGVSYRPGARFGPQAVRQASRHLRPAYNPAQDVSPFRVLQAADAGDVGCNPFDIDAAIQQIDDGVAELIGPDQAAIVLGGDHTVALGALRAVARQHGPVALVHFDAHLDTWDSYFGADRTHGTVFRRAFEEGLLLPDASTHIGIRGPLYDKRDLDDDGRFGFSIVEARDIDSLGHDEVADAIRSRVADAPVYVSIDIDVLDPAFAPGTGTPEIGGLSSRELLALVRALPRAQIRAADIVEVSPPYDHAEMTSLAAATLAFELMSLMAGARGTTTPVGPTGSPDPRDDRADGLDTGASRPRPHRDTEERSP